VRRFLRWLVGLVVWERHDIGRLGSLYMTRWCLFCRRYGEGRKLFLHKIVRPDADAMHNHPWPFWALILWRGYVEVTPAGASRKWPGMLLRRPPAWRHRVIPCGGPSWSLVWAGKKVQSWGFFCAEGFRPWRDHARALEATGDGCGPLSPEGGQTP
jgi:hypothetical protein